MYLISQRIEYPVLYSIIGFSIALLFSTNSVVWEYATQASLFPLLHLLSISFLYHVLQWYSRAPISHPSDPETSKYLYAISVLGGLTVSHLWYEHKYRILLNV